MHSRLATEDVVTFTRSEFELTTGMKDKSNMLLR